jgi:hypothetical protein
MRLDKILARLTPTAAYTFETTTQKVLVRRGPIPEGETTVPQVELDEIVPILDSYAAVIWNDQLISKPTEAECIAEWTIMQNEDTLKEIDDNRRYGILNKYPVHVQLEAIFEKGRDRPELYDEIDAHILAMKAQYPKPGEE